MKGVAGGVVNETEPMIERENTTSGKVIFDVTDQKVFRVNKDAKLAATVWSNI